MWFIFLATGLALLLLCGLYARHRLGVALGDLGVGARSIRVVRWILTWLLFGYPLIVIGSVVISRAFDLPAAPRFDGLVASWLAAIPFIVTALIVFQAVPWLLAIDLAHVIARRRGDVARVARLRTLAVLGAFGVFALYTPIRILAERGEVRIRQHEVVAPGAGTAPAKATPPFRIAFLADVQQDAHTDADRARELYAVINASKPDVVLSGGDWINRGPDHIESAAAAAGTLQSRLGTFSVRGDHENFAYDDRRRSVREIEQAMERHGVAMVHNGVRWFEHHGQRIAVVFLDYNYIYRVDRPTIATLLATTAGADYTIVVTHQLDDALATLLKDHVDLVLGAHTHGGQVNPVLGFVHAPLARLETPFIDGRYALGTTTVLMTAGIGMSIVPIRYAAPGSIELIEVRL